jgi:acetyl-CoA carboxylase biotin carboxyl carrier protein
MGQKESDSDFDKIEKLIEIMKANDLVEVEIKHGDDKILLKRASPTAAVIPIVGSPPPVTAPPVAVPASQTQEQVTLKEQGLETIKSPLVGTFYSQPSPDSDAFVEVGSKVEPKSVVCIIEAMKVMNEIKAEMAGTIAEILVKNGQAVEFGQPLFKIKPE